jgi:hypothetical protein
MKIHTIFIEERIWICFLLLTRWKITLCLASFRQHIWGSQYGAVAFVCAETFRKHKSFLWLLAQASSANVFQGYWGFNWGPPSWGTPKTIFCNFFPVRVSQIICLGCLQTVILLISASWEASYQVWATSSQPPVTTGAWIITTLPQEYNVIKSTLCATGTQSQNGYYYEVEWPGTGGILCNPRYLKGWDLISRGWSFQTNPSR